MQLTPWKPWDQAFKTYLMFESKRTGQLAFPVPILVYSNWQITGTAKWVDEKKAYVASELNQAEGTQVTPTAFEPEWSDRWQLARYAVDN